MEIDEQSLKLFNYLITSCIASLFVCNVQKFEFFEPRLDLFGLKFWGRIIMRIVGLDGKRNI